jgi:hypothetical protein
MTQEQYNEIENLINSPSKSNLAQANMLVRLIDENAYINSCFCSASDRRIFAENITTWLTKQTIEPKNE